MTGSFFDSMVTATGSVSGSGLCVVCKGSKMLCGKDRCPLMVKFYSQSRTAPKIDFRDIRGSSPPAVFVGRYGYPKVDIGPLLPPEFGDTTILDTPGAEKLIGNGDMLFSPGLETERIQCGYISGSETETLTRSISEQKGYGRSYNTPYYLPEVSESGSDGSGSDPGSIDMHSLDSRFEEAARMVVTSQRGSTSDLQRKLGMGYARAGKVMDQLEAAGIVGPQEGSKPRQVLIGDLDSLEPILDAYLHKG